MTPKATRIQNCAQDPASSLTSDLTRGAKGNGDFENNLTPAASTPVWLNQVQEFPEVAVPPGQSEIGAMLTLVANQLG